MGGRIGKIGVDGRKSGCCRGGDDDDDDDDDDEGLEGMRHLISTQLCTVDRSCSFIILPT